MVRNVRLLMLCIFLLTSHGACTINRSVPLDQGFWNDTHPVVGVVMAPVPDPEVSVRIMSTTPFGRSRTMIMSHRYDQDLDIEPPILRDQRMLWHYMNSHEIGGLNSLTDIFAQGLASRGFRSVPIDGYVDPDLLPRYTPPSSGHARKDYRSMFRTRGLDLLIVLNVQRYGAYCRYIDQHNMSTDATAVIVGEMIDMETNRIMWRSTYRSVTECGSSYCGCDDPDSYPNILEELGNTLNDAAKRLADDFFSGASK